MENSSINPIQQPKNITISQRTQFKKCFSYKFLVFIQATFMQVNPMNDCQQDVKKESFKVNFLKGTRWILTWNWFYLIT